MNFKYSTENLMVLLSVAQKVTINENFKIIY